MHHFRKVPIHWALNLREELCWVRWAALSKIWTKMVWYKKWACDIEKLQTLPDFIISTHNSVINFPRRSIEVIHEYNIETTRFDGLRLHLGLRLPQLNLYFTLTDCVTLRKWFNLFLSDFPQLEIEDCFFFNLIELWWLHEVMHRKKHVNMHLCVFFFSFIYENVLWKEGLY